MFKKIECKLGLAALAVELDILLQLLQRHSIPECAHSGVDGTVVQHRHCDAAFAVFLHNLQQRTA